MSVITVTRLLGLLCRMKSMRETTEKLNTEKTIKNIAKLLEIEFEELPHYGTINNVFEKLDISELRKIQKYMVNRLIRSKKRKTSKRNKILRRQKRIHVDSVV